MYENSEQCQQSRDIQSGKSKDGRWVSFVLQKSYHRLHICAWRDVSQFKILETKGQLTHLEEVQTNKCLQRRAH